MPVPKQEPDPRPIVCAFCPKCRAGVQGRAGSIERCECGRAVALLSLGKKLAPPKDPYENPEKKARREKFEREAQVMLYGQEARP